MTVWWGIVALLLIAVGVQFYINRKQKSVIEQHVSDNFRLERRLADTRKDLAELNARRKKLLAASTQGLIIVERDGRISSANKVAKRLFGKLRKEETTLMRWTRQHQLHELIEQTLAGEKMPAIFCNAGDKILEAHARSIKENGEIVAVALAVSDVTELQKLSQSRRYFVTNISHELRTPLASLQLLTETLLKGALYDKEVAPKLVEKIAAQVDTLSQLAQEVLDLSLIESGRAPFKLASMPLHTIAQTQIDHLLMQAERKNIELKVEIPEDILVLVDQAMVNRVFMNLVHNAIKFTEKGGVTVSAQMPNGRTIFGDREVEPGWIVVGISDTGIGIPKEDLPRIFERFYKVDRARSVGQESGTGLGLAIAKYIIEAHGGEIWAEANGRAKGTTFYFTLPTDDIVGEEV
ncbi:MAG: PAS domain S-box protein [Anaerolineae bacterium]|nr:PAS domain S-box protein [Anaerolineae bacterium]